MKNFRDPSSGVGGPDNTEFRKTKFTVLISKQSNLYVSLQILQDFRKNHNENYGLVAQLKNNFTQLLPAPRFMLPLAFGDAVKSEPLATENNA